MKSKRFNVLILIPITFFIAIALLTISTINYGLRARKIERYLQQVIFYSKEYALEVELVLAVIQAESSFNCDAVSQKGAVGLMQLMPSTASYIAQVVNYKDIIDLKDANCNLRLGCAYLSYLCKRFKYKNETLCAYNAGEGRVRDWLSDKRYSFDGKRLDKIGYSETKKYVKRVLAYEKKIKKYLMRKGYYAKDTQRQFI